MTAIGLVCEERKYVRNLVILSCFATALLLGIGCQLEDTGDPLLQEGQPAPSAKDAAIIPLTPVTVSASFREEMRAKHDAVAAHPKDGPLSARLLGVFLSSQQSTSAYHFIAETGCCFDEHYWYLQYPTGQVQYLGYTELFKTRISFTLPLTAPSGAYKILLDAYIYDIVSEQWLLFERESETASVPLLVASPDVGVISGPEGCGSSPEVMFGMDNEDHNEASSVSGWVGKDSVDGSGNTKFYFCRVSGYNFASLQGFSSARTNYAVLRLGASCPPGSVPFGRYFDNEDDNNKNFWSGNISPSTNIGNTWMRFCLFKGDGSIRASGLPSLGFEYGVFAGSTFGFADNWGNIFTDDEDHNNANSYDANSAWSTAAQAIVSAGGNTTLRTARRSSSPPYCTDGRCNGLETASSCRQDCGFCGDGVCYGSENVSSCNSDCGYCGDGICGTGEYSTCGQDCSSCISSPSERGSSSLLPLPPPC